MATFTNFTEEMITKKATVKISQKNKFLRDQKYVKIILRGFSNSIVSTINI